MKNIKLKGADIMRPTRIAFSETNAISLMEMLNLESRKIHSLSSNSQWLWSLSSGRIVISKERVGSQNPNNFSVKINSTNKEEVDKVEEEGEASIIEAAWEEDLTIEAMIEVEEVATSTILTKILTIDKTKTMATLLLHRTIKLSNASFLNNVSKA